ELWKSNTELNSQAAYANDPLVSRPLRIKVSSDDLACYEIESPWRSQNGSCNPTLRCLSLYFLEFFGSPSRSDSQMGGDLLRSMPMLSVRLDDAGFPILGKDPLQFRLDWS